MVNELIELNGMIVGDKRFPNGELNILDIEEAIHNVESKILEKNKIVFKYEDDSELISLMFIKKQLDKRSNFPVELIIAYLPYSRMDREETPETPFTLKFICEFINDLKFDSVVLYEPHSKVSIELLNNVKDESLVLVLVDEVMKDINFNFDKDYIVYPDESALSRYGSIDVPNKLISRKKRDFETGRIINLEIDGEIKHKPFNALLLDDLCSRGGTFLLNAQRLKELGAKKIYLLVGHCENTIFDGEVFSSGLINKVFTTDTILTNEIKMKENIIQSKLEVINFKGSD